MGVYDSVLKVGDARLSRLHAFSDLLLGDAQHLAELHQPAEQKLPRACVLVGSSETRATLGCFSKNFTKLVVVVIKISEVKRTSTGACHLRHESPKIKDG